MISLDYLDHLVLTVSDLDRTCEFYTAVLGCEVIFFGQDLCGNPRRALRIGPSQKINLHSAKQPMLPTAQVPQPGTADLCFLTKTPLTDVIGHFQHLAIPIVEGPVQRTGAQGSILSVYIRDPDGNLIEVANPIHADSH
ncbi:MAG: VOC family protein [Cyanobacteria bacterium J06607_13]